VWRLRARLEQSTREARSGSSHRTMPVGSSEVRASDRQDAEKLELSHLISLLRCKSERLPPPTPV
jgi:hypothetical protein